MGIPRVAGWAASARAIARSGALVRRRDPHRRAGRPHRRAGRPRRRCRARRQARSCRADASSPRCTRRSRSSTLDRNDLPADFVARHRAVEHAQRHGEDQPRRRPPARVHRRSPASTPRCTAARSCWPGRSTRSRARSRTRSAGMPRDAAVRRHLHPLGVRPTRSHPRDITSCRCSRSGCRTSGPASRCPPSSTRTPTASIATVEEVAPGFTSSIVHRR